MSKVTILTKPNRIVIASKGVQGPPGPQGEQGIQGPKGDTGDVTPEALAARDAAQEAASTASTAASTATGAANAASDSASDAAASANLAEQARLLGATIGFATKADMDASLAHPDGTLALVTSDATAANNGTYRKTGASGSGAWVQSADRVTVLEQTTERIVEGDPKNLFDPAQVITGYWYNNSGAQVNNPIRRVTPKIAVVPGQKIAISGLSVAMLSMASTYRLMNFWSGDSHLGAEAYPSTNVNMDWMVVEPPAGTTSITLNLPSTSESLPPRLQIEHAAIPTAYKPRRRTQTALPESQFDNLHFTRSTKNLFDGRLIPGISISDSNVSASLNDYRIATSFIPVEHGKTYTISGLDSTLAPSAERIVGVGTPKALAVSVTESFGRHANGSATITVSNPNTKFITFQVSTHATRFPEAYTLRIQVEEGAVATAWEPYQRVRGIQPSLDALEARIIERIDAEAPELAPMAGASFEVLEGVGGVAVTELRPSRTFGPYGPAYRVEGTQDAEGAVLFAELRGVHPGARAMYVNVAAYNSSGVDITPKVQVRPFSVPSGQLLYEGPGSGETYSLAGAVDDYVHPSIAYDATGVGGYKYWMAASILPGYATGGATWEDEDIFVSNDAREWLRIKSLYEPAQSHHAPGLSLPPHSLVASGGRRHAFLPCPSAGETIEISVPADNGGEALDRVNITLTGNPWKHDPAVLIDGGYVYVYHSYHLPYAARPGGSNRFVVCTRTSDGVNWECVRSDGSAMPITAESSRQMFTKDSQGRYNYMLYRYNANYTNPEVIKYGPGDFEFVYGYNFGLRYAGTTPWNFDFSTPLPMSAPSAGNHPGLMYADGKLYMLSEDTLYESSNRGQSFVALPHYPTWLGLDFGSTYKKAMCLGEAGQVIVADVASLRFSSAVVPSASTQFATTMRRNKMLIQEFVSLSQFIGFATTGLDDAYINVHVDQVNYAKKSRKSHFAPYVGPSAPTYQVNNPHNRVKVFDLTVEEGDIFLVYISLTSRTGGLVSFNGLAIT